MTIFGIYLKYQTILLTAAALPAIILLIKAYRKDKLEKEPIGILLSLIFMGFIATGIAMVLEELGMSVFADIFGTTTLAYLICENYLVIGIAEEWGKYILMRIRTWKSKEFNCQFDGVIYAVFTSLGFALLENILYVFQYGLGTAMVRAITSIPGHASFAIFMGIFYGIAKKNEINGHTFKSKIYRLLSVIVPAFIHGSYDFLCSINSSGGSLIFIVFIIVLFAMASHLINKYSKEDAYLSYTIE